MASQRDRHLPSGESFLEMRDSRVTAQRQWVTPPYRSRSQTQTRSPATIAHPPEQSPLPRTRSNRHLAVLAPWYSLTKIIIGYEPSSRAIVPQKLSATPLYSFGIVIPISQYMDEIYLTKEYYLYEGEQQDLFPRRGPRIWSRTSGKRHPIRLLADNVEYAFIGD